MKSIPKSMRFPRKARIAHGPGECWYYVVPCGLEICVAPEKGKASSQVIRLTRYQLRKALEIIERDA